MKRLDLFVVLILALGLTTQAPLAMAKTSKATAPAATVASSPSAVVSAFYSQLLDTMKQGDALGFAGRYKKLTPVITTVFNFPVMTKIAVGHVWDKATPDEQAQLVSAFSNMSIATYASRFVKYDNEKFDVLDEKPATGGGVIVETNLTPEGQDPVALNYLMRQDEKGQYRIVDVFLDGAISELATRRSEFSAIANRDGVAALVNSLSDKAKQMGPS